MGLRYQKRIKHKDGLGINVSKSGLSPSVRTKYGSFGTKGFTIRTSIPGLSFRKGFGKSNSNAFWLVMLSIGLMYLAVLIIWNVARLLGFCGAWAYHKLRRSR